MSNQALPKARCMHDFKDLFSLYWKYGTVALYVAVGCSGVQLNDSSNNCPVFNPDQGAERSGARLIYKDEALGKVQ